MPWAARRVTKLRDTSGTLEPRIVGRHNAATLRFVAVRLPVPLAALVARRYSLRPVKPSSASPTDNGRYDQFLERLESDVQRLDADFRNYMRLWERFDEHVDEINEAPGTFRSIINSMRTSTVVLTHRLFDKNSIGLRKLIAQAENHRDEIDWQGSPPTAAEIRSQRDRIRRLGDVLERLRIQRNKAYAHLDEEHLLDRESFAEDIPLVADDLRKAIGLAQEIVHEHYRWRNNSHVDMGIKGAINVDHLLELIRIGRKYRRRELDERLWGGRGADPPNT